MKKIFAFLMLSTFLSFSIGYAQTHCEAYNKINDSFYISNVKTTGAMQNIDQNRSNAAFNNGYMDYTANVIKVRPGQTFTFAATFVAQKDPDAEYNVSVWADINHNKSFWDTGEKIMSTDHKPIPGGKSYSKSFTVPKDFPLGKYIIRVRASAYNGTTLKPCMGNKYSDTRDYTVVVSH